MAVLSKFKILKLLISQRAIFSVIKQQIFRVKEELFSQKILIKPPTF